MFHSPGFRLFRPRSLMLLGTTLIAAATVACSGSDDATGPSPSPSPAPGGVTTVTLKNNAATGSVLSFRRRACGSSAWGADMLGSHLLFKGDDKSWTVDAGCYDFRVTPAETGLDYLYFNGVQVGAGQTKVLEISEFPLE